MRRLQGFAPGISYESTGHRGRRLYRLGDRGRRALVVATKIDKIGKGRRGAVLQGLRRDLGVDVVAFSAVTGEGKDAVWDRIADACRIEDELRAG